MHVSDYFPSVIINFPTNPNKSAKQISKSQKLNKLAEETGKVSESGPLIGRGGLHLVMGQAGMGGGEAAFDCYPPNPPSPTKT